MKRDFFRRLEMSYRSLRRQTKAKPSIGIITGSGLSGILSSIDGRTIPYRHIACFPKPTVIGHPGVLKINDSVVVMGGRFHLYEAEAPDDVGLPVFLLRRLGVNRLIVTNAAGGINPAFR